MRKPLTVGAALLALAASALPASASLVGASIQVDWLFPDLNTTVESTGLQDPIEIGSPYDFATPGRSVSFSTNQITITNLNSSGYFAIAPFNGLDFLVYYPHLISVTEDPASNPLFAKGSVLTFDGVDGVADLNLWDMYGCAGERRSSLTRQRPYRCRSLSLLPRRSSALVCLASAWLCAVAASGARRLQVFLEERASVRERATAGLEPRVPERPGMDHVGQTSRVAATSAAPAAAAKRTASSSNVSAEPT